MVMEHVPGDELRSTVEEGEQLTGATPPDAEAMPSLADDALRCISSVTVDSHVAEHERDPGGSIQATVPSNQANACDAVPVNEQSYGSVFRPATDESHELFESRQARSGSSGCAQSAAEGALCNSSAGVPCIDVDPTLARLSSMHLHLNLCCFGYDLLCSMQFARDKRAFSCASAILLP